MAKRASFRDLRLAARFARNTAPGVWKAYRHQKLREVSAAPFRPNPKHWSDTGLHAAWLGHSTVLLKINGFTILTDPVLGEKCGVPVGPVTFGLKRLVEPALLVKDLPHIDLILLSHAHFDHFDQPTLRLLARAHTSVVTAKFTSSLLRTRRYKSVQEIGWGEKVRVGPVTISGLEVQHWGARMRTDTYRGYNGYLIEGEGRRIVFGGDTAYTDAFRRIRSSKAVDLAILPIGAYDPWISVHCNPEQAWKMAEDCRAELLLPVHHKTFHLSREPYLEPIERCFGAAGSDTGRVVTQHIGQEWSRS